MDRLQDRRVVDPACRRAIHGAFGDQRGDQHGRPADAEIGEIKPFFTRRAVARRRYMVIVPAMFIVGDDQQSRAPGLASAYRVMDVVDELLAFRDIIVGVLVVSGGVPTRFEKRISRQRPGGGATVGG
jgi:hypothetical protein